MHKLLPAACLVAAFAVGSPLLSSAGGQQPPVTPAVDVENLGPRVGATVPDFTLQDQQGNPRALSSLMGPKGAVLVFFRSADW